MRLFLIALASAMAGVWAGMAALYASQFVMTAGGEAPSGTDAQSFAVLTFVPAFLLCLLLYAPALLWLARRRRSCEPPRLFTLVPAFALNLPVFLALLLLGLRRGGAFSGAGEVLLFAAAFATAGAVFGRSFVWWCRKKSREGVNH